MTRPSTKQAGSSVMTIKMRQHVEELAAAEGVWVVFYSGGGRAFKRGQEIRIREIRGPSTYFTALHELGHLVGPGRSARKLEAEANAWVYALAVAIRPPTPGVRTMIARCLQSYLDAGRRRNSVRSGMIEPPAEHPFWDLLSGIPPTWEHLPKNVTR
jgi:hypothetical protein